MNSVGRALEIWPWLWLLLALPPAPALAADGGSGPDEQRALARDLESSDLVVRVWTRDLDLVGRLAIEHDLWTYDRRRGFALLRLGWDDMATLTTSGLVVDVDWERTDELYRRPEAEPGQDAGIPSYACYRTVEETYADLAAIAIANPTLASWVDIGDSWDKLVAGGPAGYDIGVLVLGNQKTLGSKYPFVLIAAMHAREYATAELATRFAEAMIDGYGTDPDATWILDHAEIHVVPQLNPDGRKEAEAGLSWRKNVDNGFCANTNSRGIDLNRNSTFLWGGSGSSGSACSDVYRGPAAASEPETQAIQAYLAAVFADQRGPGSGDAALDTATGLFISLHSFGEYVLFPWEATVSIPPPNNAGLATLARKFGFLNGYLACQTGLPSTAGTTVDQAYGVYGVAAYTFEVGNNFFEQCSSFESNVAPLNLPALHYAAKAARQPYLESRGPDVLGVAVGAPLVEQGTPVALTATADDTRTASNGCGTEPVEAIASAGYTVDVAPWDGPSLLPMSAVDSSFDTTVEAIQATVDTSALAPGRHLIYVVATDGLGNRGVPSAVFLDVTASTIFADDFESGDAGQWEP